MTVATDPRPFWLAGAPATGEATLDVKQPYDGKHLATVSLPTRDQIEQAIAAAEAAAKQTASLPAHARAAALAHVPGRLAERIDEVAELITAENGKPLKWS